MESNHLNSPNFLHKRQGKGKHFQGQIKGVFAAFKRKPATMLMVSIETIILRANICEYVAKWQKQGSIQLLKWGVYKVSERGPESYSTNIKFIYSTLKTALIW